MPDSIAVTSAVGERSATKSVAGALPRYLRKGDVIARLGGDEFGIILLACSLDEATRILERLNAAASAIQFSWDDCGYSVGASVGVTEITPASRSPSALLAQADIACLTAKMAGRNRISVYRPEQGDAINRHREIGVAAAPSVFIPAAERYDLIGEIDCWVVRNALTLAGQAGGADWNVRIHLNLSASSLGDPSFLSYVFDIIEGSGLPPEILVFEITETALVSNMALATTAVGKLRELGCQIALALDDFGAGLSSSNYLRQFPVDIVKIDGTFIRNMTTNAVDRHIVRSIHQIARELGAQTIAEFVEDQMTLDIVWATGITFAQGYAIHKPQSFEAIIADSRISEEVTQSV